MSATARLSPSEAGEVRRLIERLGAAKAARACGVFSLATIRKCALGEPVHRLSAAVVRDRLSRLARTGEP